MVDRTDGPGLQQPVMGRVVERAQHPGDIDQSGSFQSAFTDRSPRLTFKIQDHKVLPGEQKLTQMVISVNPDFFGIDRVAKKVIVQ